jgi:hypothetical protein
MLRIAVCDNNILITSDIENLLLKIVVRKVLDVEVDVFFDGEEF